MSGIKLPKQIWINTYGGGAASGYYESLEDAKSYARGGSFTGSVEYYLVDPKLKEQNQKLIEALKCIEPMIREAAKIDGRWNVETINRNNTPVYSVNGCELTLAHCDKILSALNSIKEATQ